jgi:hypothetical protein
MPLVAFEDSLYYPHGHILGTGESASKWITPAQVRRSDGVMAAAVPFQCGTVMSYARGVGMSMDHGVGYATAYVNPATASFPPNHFAAAALAIPEEMVRNEVVARFDTTRNAFYSLDQAYYNWNLGSSHDVWVVTIKRWDEQGVHGLGSWWAYQSESGMTPYIDLNDLDYFKLEVWGQNPVRLRASILKGHSQDPSIPYAVSAAMPFPWRPMGDVLWMGPVVEDSSPGRVLVGQPALYGADPMSEEVAGVFGTTNGDSAFYAGEIEEFSAGIISQTGDTVRIGGSRWSTRPVPTVT